MTAKVRFTWQDLQDAADAAGTLWVVDGEGNWTRDGHEVVELGDDTFEERLTTLGFKVMRHRTLMIDGKTVKVPCAWQRLGRWHHEYLVHVHVSEQVVEAVLASGLPAYLQLRRQLIEAEISLGQQVRG